MWVGGGTDGQTPLLPVPHLRIPGNKLRSVSAYAPRTITSHMLHLITIINVLGLLHHILRCLLVFPLNLIKWRT